MSEYKLAQEIIGLSVADTWDEAKLEWQLAAISQSDTPQTCLCGHFPIKEICRLKNKRNGASARVGNCCVNKFLGISSNKLFQSWKKVESDESAAFNAEVIELCYEKGILNDWERKFYLDTWRKRKLSERQQVKRHQINSKILKFLKSGEAILQS